MAVAIDGDGGHEGVSASIVACVDAPPLLEAAEHDRDLVTVTVERSVVRDPDLAVSL